MFAFFREWLCVLVGVVGWSTAIWLHRRADRKSVWFQRRDPGLICMHCGYDLRESRKRCPECGEPFWRFGD